MVVVSNKPRSVDVLCLGATIANVASVSDDAIGLIVVRCGEVYVTWYLGLQGRPASVTFDGPILTGRVDRSAFLAVCWIAHR
jgi:hypothetical protein